MDSPELAASHHFLESIDFRAAARSGGGTRPPVRRRLRHALACDLSAEQHPSGTFGRCAPAQQCGLLAGRTPSARSVANADSFLDFEHDAILLPVAWAKGAAGVPVPAVRIEGGPRRLGCRDLVRR